MSMERASNYKSKTVAAWLALLLGSLGVHRLYLYGWRDRLAWLHPLPTLAGIYGVQRMDLLGQDDRLSWLLIPLLGMMLVSAMLCGIIYGLKSDEKWDARHNPGQPARQNGWGAIIAVIASLLIGGTCLMATIAFSAQRYFESQVEAEAQSPSAKE
ncbi:TM2 domain-containing protein [Roseateles oligotrophus]|uniref:TM2 domain-containing protein n=1 Tax=Roseateles oligotrophus TaxID=1769250 RepID=A0ABT2YLI0_9BURK|nr:TM2 domain-containing protein [Roseateles oligotrophus]MCV2370903.1 TM2 domain-containing protein [Roseateles oligotrophus]